MVGFAASLESVWSLNLDATRLHESSPVLKQKIVTDEDHSRRAPEADEVRELFARFGRAYYYADVLHRGLCNLYSLSRIPEIGPVTRLRVEEHLRDAFKLTLGQVVRSLEPNVSPALVQQLDDAVGRRNFSLIISGTSERT